MVEIKCPTCGSYDIDLLHEVADGDTLDTYAVCNECFENIIFKFKLKEVLVNLDYANLVK